MSLKALRLYVTCGLVLLRTEWGTRAVLHWDPAQGALGDCVPGPGDGVGGSPGLACMCVHDHQLSTQQLSCTLPPFLSALLPLCLSASLPLCILPPSISGFSVSLPLLPPAAAAIGAPLLLTLVLLHRRQRGDVQHVQRGRELHDRHDPRADRWLLLARDGQHRGLIRRISSSDDGRRRCNV